MNERIRQLRKDLGYTQKQFANELYISENYVYMLEKGEKNISDRTIRDICSTFNASENWLRYGVGDMYQELTAEEEVQEFVDAVLRLPDADIRKRVLQGLPKLEAEDWQNLEKIINIFA